MEGWLVTVGYDKSDHYDFRAYGNGSTPLVPNLLRA